MHARWPRLDGLAYGGDYNPDQWPEEVWAEDVALMREAGVTLVSVAIFSWGTLEPRPGAYEFGWLDQVLGLLHEAGIAVDLGTPTAAPPPWFLHRRPEARPVTREGLLLGGGSRQAYCPSSPAYAAAAARITRQLAARYGSHPAVVMWHVNNEYGAPTGECYCETSSAAFRGWLRARYGDLPTLNERWGAAFWSQRYGEWDEIDVPRLELPKLAQGDGRADRALKGERPLLDIDAGTFVPAKIYDRAKLLAGDRIVGPAIIDQFDATTVVLAGQTATVDATATLIIEATQ